VNGFGEIAGSALVAHPGVDKIAFTGSAAVGKTMFKSAADTLKRVTLELGGKSPNVFFADADWEAAVDGALFGVFINQGEVCSAGSRIRWKKDLREICGSDDGKSQAHQARCADGSRYEDGATGQQGAVRPRQLLSRNRKQEAKTAIGGGRPKQFGKGFYVEPTIFLRRGQ